MGIHRSSSNTWVLKPLVIKQKCFQHSLLRQQHRRTPGAPQEVCRRETQALLAPIAQKGTEAPEPGEARGPELQRAPPRLLEKPSARAAHDCKLQVMMDQPASCFLQYFSIPLGDHVSPRSRSKVRKKKAQYEKFKQTKRPQSESTKLQKGDGFP